MERCLPEFDTVFCDWLDVTYSPEAFSYDEFVAGLSHVYAGFVETNSSSPGTHVFLCGSGVLHLSFKKRFIRVSASGGVLGELRHRGLLLNYLGFLSDWPHRVTRIDVSMDRSVSGSKVIADLWGRFKSGVTISQRPLKTSRIIAQDDQGRSTGSFYAGYRSKATRTFKVYDKRHEVLCKHDFPIPERTRYEFTMKGGKSGSHAQPSLRDAAVPAPLFWDMAGCVLKVPKDIPAWVDTSMDGWTHTFTDNTTLYERFCTLLESSPDIARLNAYASELGDPAVKLLVSRITLGVAQSSKK